MKTRLFMYASVIMLELTWFASLAFGQVLAKQYKTMALGPYSVGVVCLDGSQPIVANSGLVIISCPIHKK